jgi:hypothetical protein
VIAVIGKLAPKDTEPESATKVNPPVVIPDSRAMVAAALVFSETRAEPAAIEDVPLAFITGVAAAVDPISVMFTNSISLYPEGKLRVNAFPSDVKEPDNIACTGVLMSASLC